MPTLAEMLVTDESSHLAEEIAPLLRGIAKAIYRRDKRLLDTVATENIGSSANLNLPVV